MVKFNSNLAGTPAALWRADPRLAHASLVNLSGLEHLLVVAAHPDDETLGAGGLIARCARAGLTVTVVLVTDGGASHDDAAIVKRRAAEFTAAVGVLAPHALVHRLGFADGETRENEADIATALQRIISSLAPSTLVVAPWTGDGHRDHRVVGEVVARLAEGRRVLGYPVWMWHWGSPHDARIPWGQLVRATIDADTKSLALREYESQAEGDSPILRSDFLQNFEGDQEWFIDESGGLPQSFFDATYGRRRDPWGYEGRWYEERKRALTVASLPDEHYDRGLEIGCSIGVLTEQLALRCSDLLALDISPLAVEQARARLGETVDVRVGNVVEEYPRGTFNLIVLSEVGYYFGREGLERVLDSIEASLAPGGTFVACHWRHPVEAYPMLGDEVHEAIGRRSLSRIASHRERDFVLEVFSSDDRSVAGRTGLL